MTSPYITLFMFNESIGLYTINRLLSSETSQSPSPVSVDSEYPRGDTALWISPDPWPRLLLTVVLLFISLRKCWGMLLQMTSNTDVRAHILWFCGLSWRQPTFLLHSSLIRLSKNVLVVGKSFIYHDTALLVSLDTLAVYWGKSN